MNVSDIKTILSSGDVNRYHAMPCIKEKQTNSQHQWRAAMILGFIYGKPISYDMMMGCLLHDFYEIFTGDIPSTVKWAHPEIKNVVNNIEKELAVKYQMYVPTKEEKDAIKIADCLEMITFLRENADYLSTSASIKVLKQHIDSILADKQYENTNIFNKENINVILGEF